LGVTTAEDVGADAGGAAWQLTLVNGDLNVEFCAASNRDLNMVPKMDLEKERSRIVKL